MTPACKGGREFFRGGSGKCVQSTHNLLWYIRNLVKFNTFCHYLEENWEKGKIFLGGWNVAMSHVVPSLGMGTSKNEYTNRLKIHDFTQNIYIYLPLLSFQVTTNLLILASLLVLNADLNLIGVVQIWMDSMRTFPETRTTIKFSLLVFTALISISILYHAYHTFYVS